MISKVKQGDLQKQYNVLNSFQTPGVLFWLRHVENSACNASHQQIPWRNLQPQSTRFKCYGEMTLFIFNQLPKQFFLFSDPSLLILFWDFFSLALASRSLSYPSFLFPFAFVLSPGLRTCLCVNAGITSLLSKDMFCLFFFFFFHVSNISFAICLLSFQSSFCVIWIWEGCLHTSTGSVKKRQITYMTYILKM